MIAMVMCAGEGTRLRPLTYILPKPLVPVCNRPVLEYTLLNLKKHGIREVVINLRNTNQLIQKHFKDGSSFGLTINYSIEKNVYGTAGGVKCAERFFNDSDPNLLVVSGDNLTDINFSKFFRFHKNKKSQFSIAVTCEDSRLDYGVTLFKGADRIRQFLEKPSWAEIFTNYVNTGIYLMNKNVLTQIPKNIPYDFGHELLPKLLSKKVPIYGYKFNEFWTDIGTLDEYRKAQEIVGDRRIETPPKGEPVRSGIWVGKGTRIPKNVQLKPPCSIGENCTIAEGAVIGPYSYIGDHCIVGRKSVILRSILWNGSKLGEGVRLHGTIVSSKRLVPAQLNISSGIILNGK